MNIAVRFSVKKQLIVQKINGGDLVDHLILVVKTRWKFYPKQISVFKNALSIKTFHDNFIGNVECYINSFTINCNSCDFNIILKAKYQNIPDFIDVAWCRRIIALIRARTEVEEALALLSTIGGAYSCLGERDVQCAEKAGMVAMRQLKLSTIRGDPNLVTRCFIYRVYSLCQKGEKKQAIKTMKQVIHPLITKMTFNHCCDEAVKNMYRAASHRIRYLTITNEG